VAIGSPVRVVRRGTRTLPTLVALLCVPAAVHAQDTEWNRYTLEDLGGVFVHFEVGEACEAAGISAALYEADVSLKLMDSDVGLLTQEEMLANPAMPELRVTLDCASGSNGASGTLAWSVALRVQQSAQMLRDTQITLPEAVTWYTSEIGASSEGGAADALGNAVMRQIGAFAEAWAAVHAETEGGSGG
jgi:hypothetical protein